MTQSMRFLVGLLCIGWGVSLFADEELSLNFKTPPDIARPHTWWHWMNGNISREGITADLEAMKRVGVGGAQIFNADCGIPEGPVAFMSPEWRDLVKHAVTEADRLGLELCIHNCAGWSSSGGPWITPDLAMQKVVWTETIVTKDTLQPISLSEPKANKDYYRDIAVLAFPTPDGDDVSMKDQNPVVRTCMEGVDASTLLDNNHLTTITLGHPTPDTPQYIELAFKSPYTVRECVLTSGSTLYPYSGELQVSEDGKAFRSIVSFTLPPFDSAGRPFRFYVPDATARYFRLTFTGCPIAGAKLFLSDVALLSQVRLQNWSEKAGYSRVGTLLRDPRETIVPECCVAAEKVLDLTKCMKPGGKLEWKIPDGKWTLLRMGYTPTGKTNHPAPKSGLGLECDKLSKKAAEVHWANAMEPILKDIGPLAGKGLKHVLIDSYEVGAQNWTPKFREDFKQRRHYDLLRYLPALTGRIVNNPDETERFLADIRRTIADLFADNYYGHFQTMAHKAGLQLSAEPYGNGGFDELTSGGRADIPMTEFWVGQGPDRNGGKLASSIAHTYGRTYVGAESFTASSEVGRWTNDPYSIKALGDAMYTGGINRFIFHRYAHQPWLDTFPGMTMGPWGTHFERTITWWEQSSAWLTYLARCQYLLQKGRFVGDVCYYVGEEAPNTPPGRQQLQPMLPEGYDYDTCDTTVLMTRMGVKDNQIILPDGMRYRVLVLPPSGILSPAVLGKVGELVQAGATVVGPKPKCAPGLEDYPACDQNVAQLAQHLWGNCDGRTVTENVVGKGRILWGRPMQEILTSLGTPPDFECTVEPGNLPLNYIHRTMNDADVYFLANWKTRTMGAQCTFRVCGKQPELWDPVTGQMTMVSVFSERDGHTVIPIMLEPRGSVFVIFRKPVISPDPLLAVRCNGDSIFTPQRPPAGQLTIKKALYCVLADTLPGTKNVTAKLSGLIRDNALTVTANSSLGGDPAPMILKELRVDYIYAGKHASVTVPENQVLKLPEGDAIPGGKLEIVRGLYGKMPPEIPDDCIARKVDVTDLLNTLVKDGHLSVLAGNQLAGDPAPMTPKQLRIEYELNGIYKTAVFNENEYVELPDSDMWAPPAAETSLTLEGKTILSAWKSGTYEAEHVSGKKETLTVDDLPEPITLEGSWEVQFHLIPPKTEKILFDKLVSWTERPEPEIKYFSGTATYTKTFEVRKELLSSAKKHYLDLGRLENIAKVKVNGKEYAVLWKPPYHVDISDAIKVGTNQIEIDVTNLWPNRLIGDEQYPDDCEWNEDGSLKKWPDWFVNKAPRPSSQRTTFTTWKHYKKDSPLLESGLFGPVKVYAVEDYVIR